MSIKCNGINYKSFNFPVGERHIEVKGVSDLPSYIEIEFNYENDAEIMELLLLANALKEVGASIDMLHMPYVPYSRQDRINHEGECFSLKVFCDLINSIGAKTVKICDPHSDVTPALLNNCFIRPQHEIFLPYIFGKIGFYLVSPDGGALKKIYKLAAVTNPLEVIECSKKRNTSTGEITGVNVPCSYAVSNEFVIVDDICDGGRTFIEIAKEIKRQNPSAKVILMVTHGFFTKGLQVFDGLIDEIYTLKGRVK